MRFDPKIIPIDNLANQLDTIRNNSKKVIVQCHGVFDLLHVGHIKHLN